jgi:septum formation protein
VPELILASQSPRRQALLAALGVKFTVQPADVDESPLPGESPDGMVCRLCRVKALAVAVRQPGAIVLAADTVVALDGRLFGKPADAAEATTMLRDLRGRSHTVFTALALVQDGVARTRLNASQVIMRDYSDAEITAYVASGDPLDKAGAYAIQHPAFSPAADWEGCYAGIMGLPLAMARELLMEAGAPAAKDVAAVCHALGGGKCCTTSVTSAASATSAASTWSNHA